MFDYSIKNFKVLPLKAALNQPFRVATGQHDQLDNLLFVLTLSSGIKGYGEAAIATHITKETISATENNLRKIGQWLLGKDISDYLTLSSQLHEKLPQNKAALAAVEIAIVDALTKSLKIPLWKFFGNKPKKLVSDITIVIADLEETKAKAQEYYKKGFRSFKIKIGKDFDLDVKRVVAVKKIVKSSKIILDANQGFSADETLEFVRAINKFNVKPILIEQPVARNDWEGLKNVTKVSKIDICADESVSSLKDAVRAIKEKAVDAINIKFMKTGVFESREIAQLAKANGIKLMIGGMMESSLAMTAAAQLASGLGCFDFVDLDTPFFIKNGLRNNPCLNSKGVYDLKKSKPGVGIDP